MVKEALSGLWCGSFDGALRRAAHVVGKRAVRQSLRQMHAADFLRAVEIGEGAGHAQHAVIAARR